MEEEYKHQKSLTRGQKTGFVLLLVFALLTVGMSFLQIRNTIYGPFVQRISEEDSQAINLAMDEDTRLQQIDTDHDGIDDYRELNFYSTSPYIADTDSDGKEDKEEIDAGTDPLCPEGTNCDIDAYDVGATTTEMIGSALADDSITPAEILVDSQFADASTSTISDLIGGPQELRQMLLATGKISEEELAKIDDEALMKMIENIISKNTSGE